MGNNPKEVSSYEILYTKAADKFLKTHEDVRQKYEENMHELLIGEHPESVDVKRIQGKKSVYKDSYFYAKYSKIAARRGGKRAMVAIAHSMILAIYHMLLNKEHFCDLGSEYLFTIYADRSAIHSASLTSVLRPGKD